MAQNFPVYPAIPAKPYVSGQALARLTSIMLILNVILGIIASLSDAGELLLLGRLKSGSTYVSEADIMSSDSRQELIAWAQLALFLATAIIFCMWLYRAHSNVRALGARGLHYTPGWAVGWYFVPLMNLFKPYGVMKELWKASTPQADNRDGDSWPIAPTSGLLGVWWAFWLLNWVLGQIINRGAASAETLDAITTLSLLTLVADIAVVIAAACLRSIVARIAQWHEDRAVDMNDPLAQAQSYSYMSNRPGIGTARQY